MDNSNRCGVEYAHLLIKSGHLNDDYEGSGANIQDIRFMQVSLLSYRQLVIEYLDDNGSNQIQCGCMFELAVVSMNEIIVLLLVQGITLQYFNCKYNYNHNGH